MLPRSRRVGVRSALIAMLAFAAAATQYPVAALAADPSAKAKNAAATAQAPAITGTWEGKLGGRLRFVVHLSRDDAGAWRASADSPDQGATGLAVDWVTVAGDSLRFGMSQVGGEYAGLINAARSEIAGTWKQGAVSMPLVLGRQAAGSAGSEGPNRPQQPKPPFPYDEILVSYTNPNDKSVTLAGTLTVPKGSGPAPCAVPAGAVALSPGRAGSRSMRGGSIVNPCPR